jgi:XRE family aerobic/anaerobic benzoate catabolism transcriptional regulator
MAVHGTHPPVSSDRGIAALQVRVGARVRGLRAEVAMSRRVLSEVSGVSPRYLAQLEAGEGNISIGLLLRVAEALGVTLETLVCEAVLPAEARHVGEGFDRAGAAVRGQVRALLDGAGAKLGRVCLIGLRGAGKFTLGAAAERELGLPFIEFNREIEAAVGMPIGEVMALYGADGYRQLEADALDRFVAEQTRVVVTVAGGIVGEAGTFDRLLGRFHTVWLRASPKEHMARVRAQGDTRPMAGDTARAMAQLRLIVTGRGAEYGRADAVLDTGGVTVEASLAGLLGLIEQHGFVRGESG